MFNRLVIWSALTCILFCPAVNASPYDKLKQHLRPPVHRENPKPSTVNNSENDGYYGSMAKPFTPDTASDKEGYYASATKPVTADITPESDGYYASVAKAFVPDNTTEKDGYYASLAKPFVPTVTTEKDGYYASLANPFVPDTTAEKYGYYASLRRMFAFRRALTNGRNGLLDDSIKLAMLDGYLEKKEFTEVPRVKPLFIRTSADADLKRIDDQFLKLREGEILLSVPRSVSVSCGIPKVDLKKNAIASIERRGDSVAIRNICENHRASITVTYGPQEFPLSSGEEITFAEDFNTVVQNAANDGILRRNVITYEIDDYGDAFSSEFSEVSLFKHSPVIKPMKDCTDKSTRRVFNKMMKMAACLEVVTEGHGNYRPISNPGGNDDSADLASKK